MSIGGNHMNGRIDSGLGQIIIDTDVIATYAGSVAVECFGIVGMAAVSMKDGLVKLLGKNSLKHGISVRITEDNKIRLNFHVIVAYGVNISTIADNLVSNVKYKVEAFTGMEHFISESCLCSELCFCCQPERRRRAIGRIL